MTPESEYKKIKSFFITLFTITSVCITIIAIFSFKDFMSLKEDYNNRLEKIESQVSELISTSEKTIQRTEERSINEIENIKNSVNLVARQEAIDRINETFKYGSIEKLVEEAAENALNEELDKIVQDKIQKTENEINEITEATLSLMMYMDQITFGDPNGLVSLSNIVKNDPSDSKKRLAKKIIDIKAEDYKVYFEDEIGTDIEKYLDYIGIKKEIRNDKPVLINSIRDIILKNDQGLHEIAAGTMALQKLGYNDLKIFDLEAVKNLKIK